MASCTNATPLEWATRVPLLIWQFTESDFATFLVPDTAFGISGALGGGVLSNGVQPSVAEVLLRLPLVVLYNWANLLCFNIANQWPPESVAEDRLNKPWRPLPMGNITSQQARRTMLVLVPATLWLDYCLGVYAQGTVIHIIIWLYNGLGGSDEPFVRELLLSVGYAMFNGGSLQIALGHGARINGNGIIWTGVISGVILTCLQIQDLKDMAGDRLRQRKTLPLFLGDATSRRSIAIFVCFWSCICAWFWSLSVWTSLVPSLLAALIAWSVLTRRGQKEDRRSWHMWCCWLTCLYWLPIM